ncbi:hypothetical protein [Billgrantia desiderata]|uniref:hypothetical protein n=1 Tax=Billgrantia desiderata TaxID=52021 RepID=UPI001F26F4B6|nr:hypothetical protein [Halomonas desiderata]MCE8013919.1 hypothetical protein [Halomonas desiderata]
MDLPEHTFDENELPLIRLSEALGVPDPEHLVLVARVMSVVLRARRELGAPVLNPSELVECIRHISDLDDLSLEYAGHVLPASAWRAVAARLAELEPDGIPARYRGRDRRIPALLMHLDNESESFPADPLLVMWCELWRYDPAVYHAVVADLQRERLLDPLARAVVLYLGDTPESPSPEASA